MGGDKNPSAIQVPPRAQGNFRKNTKADGTLNVTTETNKLKHSSTSDYIN
jgi:hypothetical protein